VGLTGRPAKCAGTFGLESVANAENDSGQIVGYSAFYFGGNLLSHRVFVDAGGRDGATSAHSAPAAASPAP
jgi:hypothetical protein